MTDEPSTDAPSTVTESREADMRHAARSGGVQVLTVIAQGVLPLAQVLFARLFGAVVFGSYQISVAFLEMLTRGGTGGADKAMLRYISAARARGDAAGVDSALFSGLRQGAALGGILAVVLLGAAGPIARWFHQPTLATSLPVMAPAIVFTGLMYILVQATLGAKVTRPNFIVRGLCEPTFLLVGGLVAATTGRDVRHLAWGHVAAALATLAVAALVTGRVFGPALFRRLVRAKPLPGFARFSMPLGASEIMNAVLQRADIVMLTAYCGARDAGIYAAAEFLGRIVANVRYAFDSIAASVLSEALQLSDHARLQYNLRLMTRWVLSVAAPIAVLTIVFRRDLLGLYGGEFVAGATAMLVLAVGHLINATNLTPWVLVVSGRSGLMLSSNLLCAGINIGLGLLLIPRFGIVGTACSLTASVVIIHGIFLVSVWRLQKVQPFDHRLVKPLFAAAVMLPVQFGIRGHVPGMLGVALTLFVGLAVYLALLLALGLPEEERRIFDKLKLRGRSSRTRKPLE
jgi:O-antigen/teichoic acid export membrane protein